jgi:hypothetical protein
MTYVGATMLILIPLAGRPLLKLLNNPLTPNLVEPYISDPELSMYDARDPVRIIAFLFPDGDVDGGAGVEERRWK